MPAKRAPTIPQAWTTVTAPSETEGRDTLSAAATIFVCTTCRRKRADVPLGYDLPGEGLCSALVDEVARRGLEQIAVTPVECLAVCRRPCTVAFVGNDKWTHLVGDLDATAHVEDIVTAALAFASSADGVVPWMERPQSIRSGGIARIPPVGFTHVEKTKA